MGARSCGRMAMFVFWGSCREAGRQGGRATRGSSAKLNSLLSSDSDGEMVKRSPNGVAIDFIHISVVEPIQGQGL